MNLDKMNESVRKAYTRLIESKYFLVLLVAEAASILGSIFTGGLIGVIGQIIPIIIFIGLLLAKNGNVTGIKMVRVCALILFWIIAAGGVLIGVLTVAGVSASGSQNAGGVLIALAILAGIVSIFLFYYWDISKIFQEISSWFISENPPETRFKCRISGICVCWIIVQGLIIFGSLTAMSVARKSSFLIGNMLNDISGMNNGMDLMRTLIPGGNVLSLIPPIAAIAKYVCIIVLYSNYSNLFFEKKVPEPVPVPIPQPKPVEPILPPKPEPQPLPKPRPKRSVEIIFNRQRPINGRFAYRMTEKMVVGRRPECSITVTDDKSISGNHLLVYIKNNKLYAKDNHSHNGTYLNGKKMDGEFQIHRGDEVRLGNSSFRIDWKV